MPKKKAGGAIAATIADPERAKQVKAARTKAGKFASTYDPVLAIAICERIAEGETLSGICATEGMPDRKTFRGWVVRDEGLRRAYDAAREVKSHSLFDEVLDITRRLKEEAIDNAKVNALRVALDNLRWAAGKLNPKEYGEKSVATPGLAIQINTTLNLGATDKQLGPAPGENLYSITVPVPEAGGGTATDGPPRLMPPKTGDRLQSASD